eukprot:143483_1
MSTTNSVTTITSSKKRSFDQIGSDDEEIENEPAKKRIKLAYSISNNKQQQNQADNDSDDEANQTNNDPTNNNQLTLIQEMTGIINTSQLVLSTYTPEHISHLIAEFSFVNFRK